MKVDVENELLDISRLKLDGNKIDWTDDKNLK